MKRELLILTVIASAISLVIAYQGHDIVALKKQDGFKAAPEVWNKANGRPNVAALTKNIDREFERKIYEIANKARPHELKAKSLMENRRFEEAINSYDDAIRIRKEGGLTTSSNEGRKIECLYRLSKYEDVAKLYSSYSGGDVTVIAAIGLSCLNRGNIGDARECFSPEMLTRYLRPERRGMIPKSNSPSGLMASLHLARALEFWYTNRVDEALEELTEADKVLPAQPIISHYMVKVAFASKRPDLIKKHVKAASVANPKLKSMLPGAGLTR